MELRHREGLGDVVITAGFEGAQDVVLGSAGGQHQNGNRLILAPQGFANIEARRAGQHDVEDDEVEAAILEGRDGLIAAGDHLGRVPLVIQGVAEARGDGRFVFDDQDAG